MAPTTTTGLSQLTVRSTARQPSAHLARGRLTEEGSLLERVRAVRDDDLLSVRSRYSESRATHAVRDRVGRAEDLVRVLGHLQLQGSGLRCQRMSSRFELEAAYNVRGPDVGELGADNVGHVQQTRDGWRVSDEPRYSAARSVTHPARAPRRRPRRPCSPSCRCCWRTSPRWSRPWRTRPCAAAICHQLAVPPRATYRRRTSCKATGKSR